MSVVDILFLVTVALLVFNGLRNGAVITLISMIGIPLGFAIAYFYGPGLTETLASNGFSATPLISYAALFLGTVLIAHLIGNFIRGIVKNVPLISQGDTLLGGALGFVEAWLLWLFLLIVLGSFLGSVQTSFLQHVPGLNLQMSQLQGWHDFYNQAITNSLFAKVNGFFVKQLPALPNLPS